MATGMHALVLLALKDLEQQAQHRNLRRRLRDAQNPFEIPEEVFQRTFRISKEMAHDLVDSLRPRLRRRICTGLSVECQVLIAVRFFAAGSLQRSVGSEWGITVSQPSVSRCLRDVTNAIVALLLRQWVQFPASADARARAKLVFFAEGQPLFGVIGAIDCTHIILATPHEHQESYVNQHGTHSLNVQMICDAQLKILNINARYGGAHSDSFIWSMSPARRLMNMWFDRGERHTWLVGDSSYSVEPWLLTPLPDAVPDTPEFQYSHSVSKCWSPIEHCFAVLRGTWRCLSKNSMLMYHPEVAANIVNACAVLHNMRLHYNMPKIETVDGVELEPVQPS